MLIYILIFDFIRSQLSGGGAIGDPNDDFEGVDFGLLDAAAAAEEITLGVEVQQSATLPQPQQHAAPTA